MSFLQMWRKLTIIFLHSKIIVQVYTKFGVQYFGLKYQVPLGNVH